MREFSLNFLKNLRDLFLKKFSRKSLTDKPSMYPYIIEENSIEKSIELLGIKRLDSLENIPFDTDLRKRISYNFVKKHLLLPLYKNEHGRIVLATSNPFNLDGQEELRFILKEEIELVYIPKEVILAAIHEYSSQEGNRAQAVLGEIDIQDDENLIQDGYDLLEDSEKLSPVIRLLNFIITEAIQQRASDIHFEPQENNLVVRFRIDGVLQTRITPSSELQSQLLTRLKVLSKMDIAEKRLPQDGRIKLFMGGKEVDFRVSTLPIVSGERIVLRILDKGNVILGLDRIGMSEKTVSLFRDLITYPEGIILVTGPTGSGKTTTLYSALSELKDEHTNIMTVEDPVEYRLKGISQTQVHPKIGLSFAAGLRHILRQDPDIIMIGEIRDKETADIAIQSALTGHLVLSTLHTNDAPSAIARLVDMGIEPYLISTSCIGIMAQRLVRKICSYCKISYQPNQTELISLGIAYDNIPQNRLYKGKGCPNCLHSGFQGRHGIYELMPITAAIRKELLTSPDADSIRKKALEEGMQTLREHGKNLVLEGITTIEEVLRVTRQEEELL